MEDERDKPNLMGQIAGIIAMMSALVQALPPSTRKRLLRQTHAEFESLMAAMSTTGASTPHNGREGAEWIRDLFLKRIAAADTKTKRRKTLKAADGTPQRIGAEDADEPKRPPAMDLDIEF